MTELKGIIVPLVTPFGGDEQVDRARLRDLTSFMTGEEPDYLMATALTGEGPMLDMAETLLVWETIFESASGSVGVIPAIISTRTATAVDLAKAAHAMGARAVMAAPVVPELYAGRSESDVTGFYAEVAAATPLPLILFNYPSLTGVDLTPEFTAKLAAIDGVSYIKESTGDSKRVHAIQRLCPDGFKVICGNPNAAFESISLGCDTWITGIMNVAPRSSKEMLRLICEDQDLENARKIYFEHLLPIVDMLGQTNNPTGTIKAGLRSRGVDVGIPRTPGSDIAPADMNRMKNLVRKIQADEAAFSSAA